MTARSGKAAQGLFPGTGISMHLLRVSPGFYAGTSVGKLMNQVQTVLAQAKAGKVRLLGVTTPQRAAATPAPGAPDIRRIGEVKVDASKIPAGLFDKARGRMVGSEEYLTKPFTKDSLLKCVAQHARREIGA